MTDRSEAWGKAVVLALASIPAGFAAGVSAVAALHAMKGAAAHGEQVQANAYEAVFIGGPVGVLVGAILVVWIALRYSDRLTWPVMIAVLAVFGATAVWTAKQMGLY